MNDSFVFFKSFYESIKRLPEENQLELYNAVCAYALYGEEPKKLSQLAEAIFILMKPNIDSAQKRYKANVENGKKGGAPKGNQNARKKIEKQPNDNPKTTEKQPNDNLNKDVDKDIDININKDINNDENLEESTSDKLQQKFVECTGSTNLNAIQECLTYLDDLPYEVIELALIKTSDVNGNWKYAKTILNNWVKNEINTIEKVKTEELNFKNKKVDKLSSNTDWGKFYDDLVDKKGENT